MLSEILRFVEMKDDPVGVRSPGGQVRKGIDDMSARVFWGEGGVGVEKIGVREEFLL